VLKKTGVADKKDIASVYPSEERLKQGPVAIIECFQNIPCNPCATSCPRDAIKEFKDINDTPEFVADECNGCAICVANCPGLAIFVVDESYSETETLVKLPYEFLPLPLAGDEVGILDRSGASLGVAKVHRVQNPKGFDRTAVVQVIVPKEVGREVRFIKVGCKQCTS